MTRGSANAEKERVQRYCAIYFGNVHSDAFKVITVDGS